MPLHNWFMREKKAKLPPYRWGDWSSDCTHSITYAVLPVAVLHLHARFSGNKSFLVVLVGSCEPNMSLRSFTGPKHFWNLAPILWFSMSSGHIFTWQVSSSMFSRTSFISSVPSLSTWKIPFSRCEQIQKSPPANPHSMTWNCSPL